MRSRAIFYFVVSMIVVGSVVFGLDWQSAPMLPMPERKVAAAAPPTVAVSTPPVVTPSPAVAIPAPVAPTPPRPKCDVSDCAAAYRTFRESDCTYMPSAGQRRLCTKGVPDDEALAKKTPSIAAAPAAATPPAPMPPAIVAAPWLQPVAPQIPTADNVAALIEQGMENNRRNDYAGAIATFNEVIRLERNLATGFYHRAAVYYNMGDYDRAIQDYDQVLRIEPQNKLAVLFRNMAYEKKRQP